MCGRFTLRTPAADVARQFGLFPPPELEPRFNIAPTQLVGAVRAKSRDQAASADGATGREWVWLRWGLVPSWAKDLAIGNRMINARAETVAEKPAFRAAFRRRRCLIVADGFYEWGRADGKKRPCHIHLPDDEPFAFAGLWERWGQGDQQVESCTIITTAANDTIAPLHDRMPVVLPSAAYGVWLDPELTEPAPLEQLLLPLADEELTIDSVSSWVNIPTHEGPECLRPADELFS